MNQQKQQSEEQIRQEMKDVLGQVEAMYKPENEEQFETIGERADAMHALKEKYRSLRNELKALQEKNPS